MPVKIKVNILQNFVAFSEYMNFKQFRNSITAFSLVITFFQFFQFWGYQLSTYVPDLKWLHRRQLVSINLTKLKYLFIKTFLFALGTKVRGDLNIHGTKIF